MAGLEPPAPGPVGLGMLVRCDAPSLAGSRLLVIEQVLPAGAGPSPAKVLDVRRPAAEAPSDADENEPAAEDVRRAGSMGDAEESRNALCVLDIKLLFRPTSPHFSEPSRDASLSPVFRGFQVVAARQATSGSRAPSRGGAAAGAESTMQRSQSVHGEDESRAPDEHGGGRGRTSPTAAPCPWRSGPGARPATRPPGATGRDRSWWNRR